ncbi:insulin-like growth factor 2 mRNA-binding protein 2 isoform X2 [Halichondria panicea]|uniref:insulin-like growth factor 2 mRNA-binding protein 2 isoform X2 n=1 Tax=Halichondria panicea TaxID=6063 RepID=UPI00312BB5D9
MTQLYVGNLSTEGDEKSIKSLFGRYGTVREVLMKNGYAFVELDNPVSADEAMRELNGSDILGHPMIVEPAHQQRPSARRKSPCGRVEVTEIPPHLTVQNLEGMFTQLGQVHKMEIEEGEYGIRKVVITYETQEQAQKAAGYFGEGISDHSPRVTYVDGGVTTMRTISPANTTMRKGSPGLSNSPSKNSDFPLRILVPNEMVGAIIGKDGATIRLITQLTKARVDVHRRESLGTTEKAVTIIGPPECCTEACHHMMKIMQHELLVTSGVLDTGRIHDPLPVVPLKVLAHNELIGRVIGKGGNTLKRIMAESGTKITISKLKELTAFNMERTITILGTIDNCKKAESLISAKLRASYESDMAQFIPASEQGSMFNSPSPTNAATPPMGGPMPMSSEINHLNHPQSLPATPTATNVRTFTDFSGEHTRLTTLHGSTGALEVNNLGGFKLGPMPQSMNGGNSERKYTLESSIDGMVHGNGTAGMNEMGQPGMNGYNVTNTMGMNGHMTNGGRAEYTPLISKPSGEPPLITSSGHRPFNDMHPTPHSAGPLGTVSGNFCFNTDYDDEISDVFSGLSFKEPSLAAPGFGRSRLRRSSAPVGNNGYANGGPMNGYGLWSNSLSEQPLPEGPEEAAIPPPPPAVLRSNSMFQTSSNHSNGPMPNGSYNNGGGWVSGIMGGLGGGAPPPPPPPAQQQQQQQQPTSNIWFGNSDSVTSGYSSSEASSLSGFSPIYSPTASTGFGFTPVSRNSPTSSTGFGFIPSSRNSPVTMVPSTGVGMTFSNSAYMDERDSIRSPFKASIPTPLTTVTEFCSTTTFSTAYGAQEGEEEDLFKSIASATLGEAHLPTLTAGGQKW